jgi:hypothetical protein
MDSSGYPYEISNITDFRSAESGLASQEGISLGVIRTESRRHAPNPDNALDHVIRFF